jgi:hypothetical protein
VRQANFDPQFVHQVLQVLLKDVMPTMVTTASITYQTNQGPSFENRKSSLTLAWRSES